MLSTTWYPPCETDACNTLRRAVAADELREWLSRFGVSYGGATATARGGGRWSGTEEVS